MIHALTQFSLKNRLLMIALGLLVMAAGYMSYQGLPVDAFPDVSPNLVQVYTETEGLAPEEVQKFVTFPVEAAMNGLPDVEEVRSVSNFGLSVVNVYFKDGVDLYFARQLVNERLQEAKKEIPEGFGEPAMGPTSTGMGQVMLYYLKDETGRSSLEELRSLQDWLIKVHLQTVPGVTEVLGIGGYEKQYHVVVHPDALLRYGLSITDVIEKIKANNLNVGAQFIEKNSEEYIVRSVGLATSIGDIENVVIKTSDGTPVFLGQLAEVQVGGAVRRGIQTLNGNEEVVAGMVIKLIGTNASTVIKDVEEKVAEVNRILPDGVSIVPYYEQKTLVQECVATVTNALLEGIVLVVLVLALFMGALRPSIVVAAAIPFSVLFAMLGMGYFGISANLMSLGGLAIAIGMMVDGTIVVVENADRMLRTARPEEPRIHVIARACMEVGKPLLFAITIIVVVFLPLFTLQGVEGKMFRPLAYTIALAMLGSLIFAIFLAPALSNIIMRRPKHAGAGEENSPAMRWLLYYYRPLVTKFVARRRMALVLVAVLLLTGLAIFPRLGTEFTPELQEGTVTLRLTLAPSVTLDEAKRVTSLAVKRMMRVPEITGIVTRIGRGEVGACSEPINNAEMFVLLKPKDQWKSAGTQDDLTEVIRGELGELPGVMTNFTQPIAMAVDELLEGVRAELALKVFGDDIKVLESKSEEVAAAIEKVPGATDVMVDQVTGTPQVLIKVDRRAIARFGINMADAQNIIRAAVGGETAGQVFEGVRRYDILVRFTPESRDSCEVIGKILIAAPGGVKVPLEQIAIIEEVVGPRQITRENGQDFITVQCNVHGRDIGSFVADAQKAIDEKVELPPGYLVTWGGQYKLQQEANRRFALVIPVTLLCIFLLLYSSFNSLKNTLLVVLNIPLALVGGVIGIWISGQNFSVPASVGFIALFGTALLNGMVLVTYLNQLIDDGMDVDEASVTGACMRLRPVLMTAMTSALGLIPLLFSSGTGSEVQRPLATVVVGGLITSTVLTLLVIPAFYKWFAAIPEKEDRAITQEEASR